MRKGANIYLCTMEDVREGNKKTGYPCESPKQSTNLLSLPIEMLVYIMSFLPAGRDLVRQRYVSRKLRTATETPSLWAEFVWPLYDPREERSVMKVLKAFGKHIKRLIFPNHV